MFGAKKKLENETEIPPLYRVVPWTQGRWKLQRRIYIPSIYIPGYYSYEDLPGGLYDDREDADADHRHMMGESNGD